MTLMSVIKRGAGALVFAALLVYGGAVGLTGTADLSVSSAVAQQSGNVPGQSLGNSSDANLWRYLKDGGNGTVTIPDQKAGTLIGVDGENFRNFKNGLLSQAGAILLLVTFVALAAFFLIRGRIKIEHGPSPTGETIERFNAFERAVHWITASSFVVLGLTGLNITYGRFVLQPVLGADLFSAITAYGKIAHNYLAFSFMIGVALMFFMWVRYNVPSMLDVKWLLKGGGLFSKGVHPDSPRFNAGQKIIFWSVILGGVSLSISGWALLFPFEYAPWEATFAIMNAVGFDLPQGLTPHNEVQLSVLWHAIVGLVMIAIVIAHIYIGSLGMEGAFDAVGSGQVDLNWAREHHNLWVAEVEAKQQAPGQTQPAE